MYEKINFYLVAIFMFLTWKHLLKQQNSIVPSQANPILSFVHDGTNHFFLVD